MNVRNLITSLLVAAIMPAAAQVTDRIVLGNAESETAHGLITYCPDNTAVTESGFLNQTGRYVKPFAANPFCGEYDGIYGGEYSFVLRVDGTKQNYLTLRTYGGDATTDGSRYHVQVEGKNLQDYTRDAVAFGKDKAPGAFAYSTLLIPQAVTRGKSRVVVRIRSLGRYWGYAPIGNFARYQYAMEGDLPPIYAVYSSTNPNVELADEVQGQMTAYATAPAQANTKALTAIRNEVRSALTTAIRGEVAGSDFKPAYANNNFNVVQCMGYAYRRGIYGTTQEALARKIRVAIDSMTYINNLCKGGATISVSAKGQTATQQSAGSGWGGLFGGQGMGMYLLWQAGGLSDDFLDTEVDLGQGKSSRREQWIAAFRESFDAGLTLSGRRYIANQIIESAHSVYGAALALYALDSQTYHNAPKLGLQFMREAVGAELWTGVPTNATFSGSLKDEDGYPTYRLGSPTSTDTKLNYWGKNFHVVTACGNGREQGYTCTSCYGNMAGRMCDMYLATLYDPYIGTEVGGEGDKDILQMALTNTKWQAYYTYPTVDSDGYRGIIGESSVCWRNRYDPGKNYYGSLITAALAGDEEVMGHVLQAYKEGHYDPDTSGKLFAYESHSYFLADAIDQLIAFAAEHDGDFMPMPSTVGQPDYAIGDPEDGVVAVKHGDTHLFVNFLSNDCPLWSGAAHIITPTQVKTIQFGAEVRRQFNSSKTVTMDNTYWNGNHKITYPDNPQMAYGGMTYTYPAYDAAGNYVSSRTSSQYYQQLLGQYLVAQNCSDSRSYNLELNDDITGQQAIDLATGESVTLSNDIVLAPLTTKVYVLNAFAGAQTVSVADDSGADASALASRVAELLAFAQTASTRLSEDGAPQTYKTSAFMPFFQELTMAAYIAQSGTAIEREIADETAALEKAYQAFAATLTAYDACEVPGRLDYSKNIGTTGTATVAKSGISSAKAGAIVYVPVVATKEGDYLFSVRARNQAGNSYTSSLNLEMVTPQQAYDASVAIDEAHTRTMNSIAFEQYNWCFHLKAYEVAVIRFAFDGTSATNTVYASYADVTEATLSERLEVEISSAQVLSGVSTSAADTERAALSAAITQAQTAHDSGDESQMQTAYEVLIAAEAAFKAIVAVWQTPVEAHYNAALNAVPDGEYRIYAEVDGKCYYLQAVSPTAAESNGAQFTTRETNASTFTIEQTNVSDGYVARSWKITSGKTYGGKTVYFTNPAMSGGNISNGGYLRTHNRGNNWTYDTQVLYYNGSAFAVRATNAKAGSWGEDSFWRQLTNKKVGYLVESAFIWHFEDVNAPDGIEDIHHSSTNEAAESAANYTMYNKACAVYDLGGRMLSPRAWVRTPLKKGFYIVNDRKVVIR